ncbi:putative glycosyltransferase [Acidiphilium multivorum AIU301]|uniref:Putative glycosyltransferase n=1 Tax=Acidiphilium multivorum (strain DSM 11245 / JCM 8867 / NBRC 100883 / AIU 301) TaxID=926570 RepID=F0IZJ5_ACIMA|nr:glycosyltransferase family 4 protein [Acidiphilium multivorum]UNC14953.1 glycosyltransferase family 4 protein [Acidiphilium multivorum]BAJ81205.1 putative glycosyltransferase [Acidiphilium multivorum AIU301]GAN74241.1 glycosyl transferase [Acidiphilium multivorum AIU301]
MTIRRVLMVPPIRWLPYRETVGEDGGPVPQRLDAALHDLGWCVDILDPGVRPWNPFGGMNPLLQSFDPLRALKILARKRRYDLIVSVFEGNAAPLLMARHVFGFRTKIILWDVGLTETWRLRMRVLDYVLPRVDGVMVLASEQKRYIEAKWRLRAPVQMIGHSVDTVFFRPQPIEPDDFVLSLGNDASRDYGTLFKAVSPLATHVKIRTSPAVVADLNQPENVEIIGKPLPFPDLRTLYAKAKLVVIPLVETLNAGGISAVLEAAAMGKPLIVTHTAVLSDVLKPGETCLTVPPDDPQALRHAIETLLAKPDLAQKLGRGARDFVERTQSQSAFAARLAGAMDFYKDEGLS